jgi:hypothetical protein
MRRPRGQNLKKKQTLHDKKWGRRIAKLTGLLRRRASADPD